MDQNQLNKIKELAKRFFDKMTFDVDVNIKKPKEGPLAIKINAVDANVLIGKQGNTLISIQKVLGRIARKQTDSPIFVDLDINDYKQKKIEYLRELAAEKADTAALQGQEKILSPMPAYERRIVHLALGERSDVVTQSIGQGPDRRVVIKPATG